jgi:hypothetical protein
VITGVLVAGFIVMMILWWGSQGVFTAFLHLMAVIAAGAVAFALWEPVGLGMLLARQGDYARGVSLLSCFILALLVFRAGFDNLVKFNMKFNQAANLVGGGICGLFIGILTSGMMVIGMSMMPIGKDLGGYQPYSVGTDGLVSKNQSLFPFGVDDMTANFYSRLSMGSFSTSTPLKERHPELVKQAFLYRIAYDPNHALSATEEGVQVPQVFQLDGPVSAFSNDMATAIGKATSDSKYTFYGVVTEWNVSGSGDRDSTIRVSPTQVRLQVIKKDESGDEARELVAPIGFTLRDPATNTPLYHPIMDNADYAYGLQDKAQITWLFTVPKEETVEHVIIRMNRYPFSMLKEKSLVLELRNDPQQLTKALGEPVDVVSAKPADGSTAAPVQEAPPSQLVISKFFPDMRQYSRTLSNGAVLEPAAGPEIESGHGLLVPPAPGNRPDPEIIIKAIKAPKQFAIVQMPMNRNSAYTYLKAAMNLAANLQPIYLKDQSGAMHAPVGYMIRKGDTMEFRLDPDKRLRSVSEIAGVNMMTGAETIYLVFYIPKGVRLVEFVAANNKLPVSLDVPAE